MPPYKKAKSKAQQRKFWALVKQGKMTKTEARGKSRKGKAFKKMPNRVKRTRARRRKR